ncbi:conserved hypothetical protein [Ricinus communis]|uniref:Uncharacterized protein n=1 Tax=Ricinus communis TaxID=3988 RepID=B9SV78_RICCO|nr:conserved hypothetical protein [Ricinus communis]|eukprot:XP_002529897.1 uncharacterized protein LOC8283920 [Ricinus communis]
MFEHLEAIEFKRLGGNEFKYKEKKEDEKETSSSDKEEVVFQALMELKGVGLWLCSIVLAGLSGDAKVFLEMRKSDGVLSNPSLLNLDSSICGVMMEKGCVLKDVKELKDSATFLAVVIAGKNSSDAAEELRRKMGVFEKMLDGLGKEVNLFFSEVLAWRNQLLDGIRFRK